MPISITTREDINNSAFTRPAAKAGSLTLRPISLGSLELLRQIGNALATGEASPDSLDLHTISQFVWVHAAPLEEVVDTIYNAPGQVGKAVALFCMDVSPSSLQQLTAALSSDCSAIQAAGAIPTAPDDDDSPNAQPRR